MSNFIKSPDGRIHPIDLVVRRPTRQMLQLWGVQELARDPSTRIEASGTPVARLHVVGAGNFARTMLLPHLKGRIELGTVVNATGLSARHVQEKFGFAEAAADVAKIAESSEGAVLIATRHHLHAPLANRFLAEHRHVFVEKPLCISRDELAGLGNAIERTRGSLMAGFNRRFAPAAVAMREMLRETPGPKSIACHVFAGPLPPDHWYANIAESGGRVLGECCHFFDLFGFLLGSPPVRVFAQSTWPATSAVSVPDSIAAQVSYADGSSAQLIYSAEGDFSVPKEAIRVFGAGVVLECENFQHLAIHRGMKTSRRRFASKGHEEEMAAWLGFLREGKAHPLPSSEALASMALTFAALDSVRENRVIGLA
jgi:predicted dehydrogenase